MFGGRNDMVDVNEKMIYQLSHLTMEQFHIFSALLDEFSVKNNSTNEIGKRIGVAKEINFPSDFDDIDYHTEELFGLG